MQVNDFVATTLEQIVDGVRRAQAAVDKHGARINPPVRAAPTGRLGHNATLLQDVEFDIAVTVGESSQSGAGLRVGVPWIGGGVEGGSNREQSAVSRIRFVVPIALPRHPELPSGQL